MRRKRIWSLPALAAAVLLTGACSEDGTGEKAGKAIDDAVEKLAHGDEGTLERAGRKVDEAAEEMSKKLKAEE
jgi:hypothetical protein